MTDIQGWRLFKADLLKNIKNKSVKRHILKTMAVC